MARLAVEATKQVTDLLHHYTTLERERAADLLIEAVRRAIAAFDSGQDSALRPFPANYPGLASYGLAWLKRHRYWFGALRLREGWVITSVIFETADIPRWVRTDPR